MTGKWVTPAWTGPDSPQGPIPVDEPRAIPMPQYTPTIIASCPRCGTDLIDEAFGYWCPGCQEAISAREACMFDETDYERD